MQIELSDFIKLYNRIETLENTVSALEMRLAELEEVKKTNINRPPFPVGEIGEKYRRLAEYLYESWEKSMELTYVEIEQILDFSLPSTAHKFPQVYWANTETHSYAKSWLAVGYKAKVIGEKRVRFERSLY